jgi:hypothetical protein
MKTRTEKTLNLIYGEITEVLCDLTADSALAKKLRAAMREIERAAA